MIQNAVLYRVDRRTGATAAGAEIWTSGTVLNDGAGVPAFLDAVTSSQRWQLEGTITAASQVLYVGKNAFDAAVSHDRGPQLGDRVLAVFASPLLTQEGFDPATAPARYQIQLVRPHVLGGLAHYEIFVARIGGAA